MFPYSGTNKLKSSLDDIFLRTLFFSLYKDTIDFNLLEDSFKHLKSKAIKILWYLRDKDGLGRRDTFRNCISYLISKDILEPSILKSIPLIGRYDDIVDILFRCEKARTKDIKSYLLNTLESDLLLAKWLPSENASSKDTRSKAKFMQQFLGFTPKDYRKTLSNLRSKLEIIETKLVNRDYDSIKYDSIPFLAKVKYQEALNKLGYSYLERRYITTDFFNTVKNLLWNAAYNPTANSEAIIKVSNFDKVINNAPKYSKEWFGDEDFFKHLKNLNIVVITNSIAPIENIAFANSVRSAMALANNKVRDINTTISYILRNYSYLKL